MARRLEGPGSEARLRALQEQFRRISAALQRQRVVQVMKPRSSDIVLFVAAFVLIGLALLWWWP